LEAAAARARDLLAGRIVWNVNSTASGGGVAEMLHVLVAYIRGMGIDIRWLVMEGDPAFFAVTKRVHNYIHGTDGDDGGGLGAAEAAEYDRVTAANAEALAPLVGAGDVVVLHDPQTAGMLRPVQDAGAKAVWRSHIGVDKGNAFTEEGWEFLRPHLGGADAFVFSRRSYAPSWLPDNLLWVIPPSIDPFSPKNQPIAPDDLPKFLARIGLTDGGASGPARFTKADGSIGEVTRRASIVSEGIPLEPGGRLVVQVSRWDRLKDMAGVMTGFASRVAGRVDAHLALVGPDVHGVVDDPEGQAVLRECAAQWDALPADVRRRVHLVSLPMADYEENAAMVNAMQRSASVIVQKSLAEGFGLTVAEGMWKAKPVVASRVGGIIDQVVPGTGLLLDDPTDLDAFGDALASLLGRPDDVARLGGNARRHVLEEFVGDRHLLQYAVLVERLLTD
jgi:trehalose synthase